MMMGKSNKSRISLVLVDAATSDAYYKRISNQQKGNNMDKNTQQPVAEVCRNSAGQIYMANAAGNMFDMSKYIGEKLYTAPPMPRDVLMVAMRDAVSDLKEGAFLADCGTDIAFRAVDYASIADRYASQVHPDRIAPDVMDALVGNDGGRKPEPVNQQLLGVAHDLDKFQRHYEQAAWQPGRMPGNELYSMLLMQIVNKARAAITSAEAAQCKCKRLGDYDGYTHHMLCDAHNPPSAKPAARAQPVAVADGWQQQVFELCNDMMTHGFPMTEAMMECMYESTGNRKDYPNSADWLARAALSAAQREGWE